MVKTLIGVERFQSWSLAPYESVQKTTREDNIEEYQRKVYSCAYCWDSVEGYM